MSERTEQIFPRGPRPEKDRSHLPWGVKYDLVYDGCTGRWTKYYRTRRGALISAWWNYHIASWGGSAKLFRNDDTIDS